MKKCLLGLTLALCGSTLAQTVTVEFWHTFGDAKRKSFIEKKAEEFNKLNPGIKVVPAFKGSYNETLQATVLASRQGNPPALVQVVEVGSQLALDSGVFQPVGNVEKTDYKDYIKPVLNYYTIGGKVNSLPFNSSSPVLYANKQMMDKAGIKTMPNTYSSIVRACEKVKKIAPNMKCITFNLHSWFFEQWMAEQGAQLVNNDNGRKGRATASNLDSSEAKTILTWIKKLNDSGYYTYSGKLEDWDGSDAIFNAQQTAFLITSTADLVNIRDNAKQNGFDVVVGFLPIPDGTKRNGVVIGGASLWITKNISDKVADAARDFALYMTNAQNMVEWHKLTGYYPVRTTSVDLLKKEGWLNSGALQTVAFNQLLRTTPNVATSGALIGSFIPVRKIIEETIQKVLQGKGVDDAAAEGKAAADKEIQSYNKSMGL
ncbi:MAG: ABC transporter substrate-binding protein [Deinococcaceae bacterium]